MNSILGLAVGVCGLAFLGYCVYFDNKRRKDPNFKKKLRERRKAARETEDAAIRNKIPPLKDNEALQKFFLEEVHLGEVMLAQGDFTNGVEHLANAVVVCSQPQQLLNVLSNTLPPQVFQLLIQQIAITGRQRPQSSFGPQILGLAEEDVE
ncbi:mitochondrial import receptor subunit TOM20, putative [Pediculus humanus corporis]|uniref:Mitochondrial import receptor subunit TOM20, putative n=1 Tax=Pediculus humanus subsp. corporis TaxID=121224 RepID=E0VQB3_PEDHC|nr:mitochondrial import receptor subunit TOM20, putative [Pediculus humanus corporis]EEB15569.1 mitochondrial import receptor subunit TOM20, putative [Pediculus humanus corporis]